MPIKIWTINIFFALSFSLIVFNVKAQDYITKNCRIYCYQTFNFCLDKINDIKRTPNEYHRMKNSCHSEKHSCHGKCTKQEITLSNDQDYKKLLELQKRFSYTEWYPYKKVNINEQRFNPKEIIKGVSNEQKRK